MKRLVMNITNRCNFKCKYCFRGKATQQDLSYKIAKKAIRELKQMKIGNIGITEIGRAHV